MKHLVRRHRRFVGHGVLVFALLATSVITFNDGTTTLFFMPHSGDKIRVGETAEIDVFVVMLTSINALGATVMFPPETLEIVGISKEKSFLDLWTEETSIKEDAGEVHFSGGTFRPGGLAGTGTMLTLTVKALRPGEAKISFGEAEIYSHDGKGLVVDRELRTMSIAIAPKDTGSTAPAETKPIVDTYAPSPDINGDGRVNLIDASILTYHLFRSYEPRFDLDADGKVGLSDISVLFARMSRS